jgi:sulfate adenylyltransferase subunit 2
MTTHADYRLSQLDELEAESIHIFREVTAEFEKPVLMFSGGKDSIVMMRLAEKAFYPAKIPFPVLQVDTGFDFPEVLATRDAWVNRLGVRLIVASVDEAIANGVVVDDGKITRNRLQIGTLLHAIEEGGFTAAFGGGRRDERRRRAPRSGSTPTATSSGSGTPRCSDRSCGACTTARSGLASTCGSSR